MKKIRTILKRKVLQALAFIPTTLPIGVTAFDKWAESVLFIYDFPDNDSTRWALATMIMHMGPTGAYKPKRYFGLALHAAASKQIASDQFRQIKERQQKQQAEATAAQGVAGNV